MKVWLVREYMDGTDWEDARRCVGADEHDAAETFAKWQCNSDWASYSTYESGKQLDVKLYAADQSDKAALEPSAVTGSTLVSVSVSFDPHFRSRIERKLEDCTHRRLNEAPVLVASATHHTRKCPDCLERVSTPNQEQRQ